MVVIFDHLRITPILGGDEILKYIERDRKGDHLRKIRFVLLFYKDNFARKVSDNWTLGDPK